MCCGPHHRRMVTGRAGSLEPGVLLPQAATCWGVKPCCSVLEGVNGYSEALSAIDGPLSTNGQLHETRCAPAGAHSEMQLLQKQSSAPYAGGS